VRSLAGIALVVLASRVPAAEQVTFPLVVDYPLLGAMLARQLDQDAEGTALLWGTRGGCRELTLRGPHFQPAPPRVRFLAHGKARVGFRFLGLCIAPVSWEGQLETLASPTVGDDWRLRLADLDSQVYDGEGWRTFLASRLWGVVKGRVEAQFADFAIDLAPPVAEAKALIGACVKPARAQPVLRALDTLRPISTAVNDEGIEVKVAMQLPPSDAAPAQPEPGLAPPELARWQAALENWDGFLVFVIKDLGALEADRQVRDDLFRLLMSSRQRLLAGLASGPEAGADPIRELFLESWTDLRRIVRQAAMHGALRDRALRYLAFMTAGDALAALDAAGPALGLEISADGLRRLARVLEPDYAGDPLEYSEGLDPELRELFHFNDPAVIVPEEPREPPPSTSWPWWLAPRAAVAASPPSDELAALSARLDRWVPTNEELEAYRDAVARLLAIVAERTASVNAVEGRFESVYRVLVSTTAWQESCWRQFVERDGKVTYLLSKSGDIGIMQVNRRVWRGLFQIDRLEWDIAYNAGAGAEILAQLFNRYGAREASGRPENAARAAYAAYNGGPDAYRRYRLSKVSRTERAIDRAFWEKFQAMAAGRGLDLVLCIENWSSPSRSRLSTAPSASTPKCRMSARSSSATLTISSRHASSASRPRASLV